MTTWRSTPSPPIAALEARQPTKPWAIERAECLSIRLTRSHLPFANKKVRYLLMEVDGGRFEGGNASAIPSIDVTTDINGRARATFVPTKTGRMRIYCSCPDDPHLAFTFEALVTDADEA